MKAILFVLTILVLMSSLVWSVGPVELTELTRPASLIVKFDKIYVLEQASIHIFDLKTFRRLKTFGKAGEGPEEFKINLADNRPLSMAFSGRKLMVNSMNKVSWFDTEGTFLGEQHVTHDMLMFPVDGQYVGIGPLLDQDEKGVVLGFRLYHGDFSPGKVLFYSDLELDNPRRLILPVTSFSFNPVYKDHIYVNSSPTEFLIDVFDKQGNNVRTIQKAVQPLKIPAEFREQCLAFFRNAPRYKDAYEMIQQVLQIRDVYPPIRDLQVCDDRIHVLTYKQKKELWECIIFDLEGRELATKFVPLDPYVPFSFYPILYSVYRGNLYSLIEDPDEEVWRLHITPLY